MADLATELGVALAGFLATELGVAAVAIGDPMTTEAVALVAERIRVAFSATPQKPPVARASSRSYSSFVVLFCRFSTKVPTSGGSCERLGLGSPQTRHSSSRPPDHPETGNDSSFSRLSYFVVRGSWFVTSGLVSSGPRRLLSDDAGRGARAFRLSKRVRTTRPPSMTDAITRRERLRLPRREPAPAPGPGGPSRRRTRPATRARPP